jgi:hypothetical protein
VLHKKPMDNSGVETAAELVESFDGKVHGYLTEGEAGTGAVVRLGTRFLVIGVSSAEFECQGQPFIGGTIGTPTDAVLEGKISDVTCTFNCRELIVNEVH